MKVSEKGEEVPHCPSKGGPSPTRRRKLLKECLLMISSLDPRATANSTMVPRWLQLRSASWETGPPTTMGTEISPTLAEAHQWKPRGGLTGKGCRTGCASCPEVAFKPVAAM